MSKKESNPEPPTTRPNGPIPPPPPVPNRKENRIMKIELGCTYQDKITGFRGVATGHCEYLSGCSQTLLTPKSENCNEKKDAHWIDDQRLELVKMDGRITLINEKTPGCDLPAPNRG